MQPEGSLLYSQEPSTVPYPERRSNELKKKLRMLYVTQRGQWHTHGGKNSTVSNMF
jgi:hypothetical protein